MVPLLVIATIVAFIGVDLLVRTLTRRRAAASAPAVAPRLAPAITPESVAPPAGLFLAPGNTWLRLLSNGNVRVGGTALLLRALGKPGAVGLPVEGKRVQKGEALFSVKFGSRNATFRAPVEGEVVALNRAVDAHPEFINAAPYESWFVELRPTNLAATVGTLPVAERAAQWARREYDRFKDLLAALTSPQGELAPQLADGGAPFEGVCAQLPPEAWDAAVKSFLEVTGGE
jgi:glycine cleavage system H protein